MAWWLDSNTENYKAARWKTVIFLLFRLRSRLASLQLTSTSGRVLSHPVRKVVGMADIATAITGKNSLLQPMLLKNTFLFMGHS
jgi:hypothetical protein